MVKYSVDEKLIEKFSFCISLISPCLSEVYAVVRLDGLEIRFACVSGVSIILVYAAYALQRNIT